MSSLNLFAQLVNLPESGKSAYYAQLLTILLTNDPSRSVIHKHGASQRSRENPGRWHDLSQPVTARHPLDSAHNPKVAGSNPAPATTKALVDRKIDQGFLASAINLLMSR